MRVVDLLPDCTNDECTQKRPHKHIEPHQDKILRSDAKYIYVQGGVGSGKTVIAVVKCHLLMVTIPGIRGIIGRRSLPKLHDTTQRIFLEVLERSGLEGVDFRDNRDGWCHRLIYPNGSEVTFRPTTDLGRFLGPEYGFFLIDEAQEEPEKTFTDLMGRLRLPIARKHLCGMLLSNPPQKTSWLYKHFGDVEGTTIKTTEGVSTKWEFIRCSTRLNPHVGKAYVTDLIQIHGPEEAMRVIEGFYGFTGQGVPVYRPPFNHNLHVGEPMANPNLGLIRSWDFGRRHPAITWHQVYRCQFRQGHWAILAELDDLAEIETPELAKKALEYTKEAFPHISRLMVLDCGDRAGVNKTEHGPGPITILQMPQHGYNLNFRYKYCEIQTGIDFISDLLRKGKCRCGRPVVEVNRRCKAVTDGFAGGYHYPVTRPDKAPKDKPVKDGYYDDVMDSVRYAAENYVRQAMDNEEWLSEVLMEKNALLTGAQPNWKWMESG